MKLRSGEEGGGQAWLLDPGEDFRLCPEGDRVVLKDLKEKLAQVGWVLRRGCSGCSLGVGRGHLQSGGSWRCSAG